MYDIVGSLPLELLIYVVEYLDLKDIVRSQRVSKRWRSIFSCNTIITPVLRETLSFLGLDMDGVSTDIAIADAMSYFRWRHGLQYARPVKTVFLPWPGRGPRLPYKIQCHSRRLCYCKTDSNEVEMLDLETGKISTWTGSETGALLRVCLSDRYLVLVSSETGLNNLTAWNIHTKQKLSQRISRSCLSHSIVEDKVVIIPGHGRQPRPVYVWDLGSNHVQSIGSFSNLKLCHMDAAENILVAFEINCEKHPLAVQQTKWRTTTGQLVEQKSFFLSMPDRPVGPSFWIYNECSRTFGHKTVTQLFTWSDKYATGRLEYDHAADRLSVQWVYCNEIIQEYPERAYLTPNLYYRSSTKVDKIAVYNATTGTATLHAKLLDSRNMIRISSPKSISQKIRLGKWVFDVFGDREVLGLAVETGVHLSFFNPKFAPDLRRWSKR